MIPQVVLLRSVHVLECKVYLSWFDEWKKGKFLIVISHCSQQLWEVRPVLGVLRVLLREFAGQPQSPGKVPAQPLKNADGFKPSANRENVLSFWEFINVLITVIKILYRSECLSNGFRLGNLLNLLVISQLTSEIFFWLFSLYRQSPWSLDRRDFFSILCTVCFPSRELWRQFHIYTCISVSWIFGLFSFWGRIFIHTNTNCSFIIIETNRKQINVQWWRMPMWTMGHLLDGIQHGHWY